MARGSTSDTSRADAERRRQVRIAERRRDVLVQVLGCSYAEADRVLVELENRGCRIDVRY